MRSDLIDIPNTVLTHETEKALLVETVMAPEPTWVPKSMCEFDRETGVLTLHERVAIEKELI